MAIAANSYGDPAEVAALVPKHANTGTLFDASTRPTLARVEGLINQISGLINSILATNGFDIPVTQADTVLALDSFVNEAVAEIIEGINGYGRFGPTKPGGGASRWRGTVTKEVKEFIDAQAVGFQRLGATRSNDILGGLAYRDTDEAGDEIHPIFQRKAFGQTFTNWDS